MRSTALLALLGLATCKTINQKPVTSPQDNQRIPEIPEAKPLDKQVGDWIDEEDQLEQTEAAIRDNQEQQVLVDAFFKEMLATVPDKNQAMFRCLTVGVYGDQAMEALPFIAKTDSCPCLLQRLCYLVADQMEDPEESDFELTEEQERIVDQEFETFREQNVGTGEG